MKLLYNAVSYQASHICFFLMSLFPTQSYAAEQPSIYINDIPLYSSLAQCAQDPVSAIIRAQASGCVNYDQYSSFSCFCIESSTQFASIISTAVQANCPTPQPKVSEPSLTNAFLRRLVIITSVNVGIGISPTPTAQVSSALEVFRSYCAKSTMIGSCKYSHPWDYKLSTPYHENNDCCSVQFIITNRYHYA